MAVHRVGVNMVRPEPSPSKDSYFLTDLFFATCASSCAGLGTLGICFTCVGLTSITVVSSLLIFTTTFLFFSCVVAPSIREGQRNELPVVPGLDRRNSILHLDRMDSRTFSIETPVGTRWLEWKRSDIDRITGDRGWLFNTTLEGYFLLLQDQEKLRNTYPVQVVFKELYPNMPSSDDLFDECRLQDAEIVFIPRFVMGNHFTLVAVDLSRGQIQYFDPNGDIDPNADRFLRTVEEALLASPIQRQRFPERARYELLTPTRGQATIPIQGENDTFCGFYVCAYAQHILGEKIPIGNEKVMEAVRHYLQVRF